MNGETRPGVSAGSKSVGAIVKCTAEVSSPSGAALASVGAPSVRASTQTMRRRTRRLIGIVSFLYEGQRSCHGKLFTGLPQAHNVVRGPILSHAAVSVQTALHRVTAQPSRSL